MRLAAGTSDQANGRSGAATWVIVILSFFSSWPRLTRPCDAGDGAMTTGKARVRQGEGRPTVGNVGLVRGVAIAGVGSCTRMKERERLRQGDGKEIGRRSGARTRQTLEV